METRMLARRASGSASRRRSASRASLSSSGKHSVHSSRRATPRERSHSRSRADSSSSKVDRQYERLRALASPTDHAEWPVFECAELAYQLELFAAGDSAAYLPRHLAVSRAYTLDRAQAETLRGLFARGKVTSVLVDDTKVPASSCSDWISGVAGVRTLVLNCRNTAHVGVAGALAQHGALRVLHVRLIVGLADSFAKLIPVIRDMCKDLRSLCIGHPSLLSADVAQLLPSISQVISFTYEDDVSVRSGVTLEHASHLLTAVHAWTSLKAVRLRNLNLPSLSEWDGVANAAAMLRAVVPRLQQVSIINVSVDSETHCAGARVLASAGELIDLDVSNVNGGLCAEAIDTFLAADMAGVRAALRGLCLVKARLTQKNVLAVMHGMEAATQLRDLQVALQPGQGASVWNESKALMERVVQLSAATPHLRHIDVYRDDTWSSTWATSRMRRELDWPLTQMLLTNVLCNWLRVQHLDLITLRLPQAQMHQLGHVLGRLTRLKHLALPPRVPEDVLARDILPNLPDLRHLTVLSMDLAMPRPGKHAAESLLGVLPTLKRLTHLGIWFASVTVPAFRMLMDQLLQRRNLRVFELCSNQTMVWPAALAEASFRLLHGHGMFTSAQTARVFRCAETPTSVPSAVPAVPSLFELAATCVLASAPLRLALYRDVASGQVPDDVSLASLRRLLRCCALCGAWRRVSGCVPCYARILVPGMDAQHCVFVQAHACHLCFGPLTLTVPPVPLTLS